MRARLFVLGLTAVNVVVLLIVIAQDGPANGPAQPQVVRAQALELVDGRGQVRAQLNVEPSGEAVFRMRGESGAIRVKLGGSDRGSGLLLLNDATEPGAQILARRSGTSLLLRNRGNLRRVIKPPARRR
jgi:hypothetical protein